MPRENSWVLGFLLQPGGWKWGRIFFNCPDEVPQMGSFVPSFWGRCRYPKWATKKHKRIPFQNYTGWLLLIGILVVAYDNPYISGMYPKQPGFLFIAQMIKVIYYMKMMKNIEELDPSRKHAHSWWSICPQNTPRVQRYGNNMERYVPGSKVANMGNGPNGYPACNRKSL